MNEQAMPSRYYRLLFKLDGRRAFLIWFSNDNDGVVERDGLVPSFSNEDALRAFAAQRALPLVEEEPALHDLDFVQTWLLRPREDAIDCSVMLAAWNLFGDIARTIPERAAEFSTLDGENSRLYDKLFYGNNLPSITPTGQRYDPIWSPEEVNALARILGCGLLLFRSVRSEALA